jgi:SAM-dependent methyltransferase
VDPTAKSKGEAADTYYDANYGNFQTELYSEIRRDAFGDDIGQNSWLTAEEQDLFLSWLDLSTGKTLLDVACGSGGPALRIAGSTGCSLVGIDIHEQAIATAKSLASERNLQGRAEFYVVNAGEQMPFPDARFDAWFFLFVPRDYDKEVIAQSGLRLLECRDVTANMATVAEKRRAAHELRSTAVRQIEGDQRYEAQQTFLAMTARLAGESRLSRFAYLSERI